MMWSLVDFLVAEARKEALAEHLLYYVGASAFVLFAIFLGLVFS